MGKEGCAFGQVSRQMIIDINDKIEEVKTGIKDIQAQNKELYNHQSNRWPPAAAWALTTVGVLLGIAVAFSLNKLLGA